MTKVSKAEFARRSGMSKAAVSQAIRDGSISVEDDGKIDLEAAQRDDEDLAEARTRKERALATIRELELGQKEKDLVDRSFVENRVFELSRQARDDWLLWPVRVSAQIAAELGVKPHDVQRVLDRAVRENLESSTEAKF